MFTQKISQPTDVNEVNFQVGDNVVYPMHGVGIIISEENQSVAGVDMTVYVISFSHDRVTLRIPKNRTAKVGLRSLSSESDVEFAFKILSNKIRSSKNQRGRIMWSKRARKYESMIHSGSLILLAEVIRDLYKPDGEDHSYSEKQIYDTAMLRFVQEYSILKKVTKDEALQKIISTLNYS
ncbi:CarD family transcriptional regulator [Lyticum sinuosum]|uniref:CarD family transcriptional regulator n=1 Tax=Lyticum sinuosum TaxID=1332059 RepID=A0AAE5AHC2_9RICK|nr:CarD family transcriptional regulator [Lyticum sinuosum]MDZ5761400.1 CarD family transcriptional regulator [Lyticum sinuosum]